MNEDPFVGHAPTSWLAIILLIINKIYKIFETKLDSLSSEYPHSQYSCGFKLIPQKKKGKKGELRGAVLIWISDACDRPMIARWALGFIIAQAAPAGNRTRVCTVAGYYSTTRPLVLDVQYLDKLISFMICILPQLFGGPF